MLGHHPTLAEWKTHAIQRLVDMLGKVLKQRLQDLIALEDDGVVLIRGDGLFIAPL